MKAVVWHGTEDVRVDEVPDPRIREATDAGSFAFGKTDLHIYDAATFVKTSDRTFRCD